MRLVLIVYCLCCVMVNEWNILLLSVCSGQSPAEADFNLLDTARKVDVYGLHLFAAHVCHSRPCFKLSYLILILQFRKCNILICGSCDVGGDAIIGVSKLSMHINNYYRAASLHGMQMQYSDEKAVHLSVSLR